jgi:hypothetical protein
MGAKFVPDLWVNPEYLENVKKNPSVLEPRVVKDQDQHNSMPLYTGETVNELMELIDIKAEAGLCQMSHGGTREFLKDIRRICLAVQSKGMSVVDLGNL